MTASTGDHESNHAAFRGDPGGRMQAMSMAAAREGFLDLPERVREEPVFVMRAGRPVMTVLSMDQYEEMWETIEFLSDQVAGWVPVMREGADPN
jgi:hypothetical protein